MGVAGAAGDTRTGSAFAARIGALARFLLLTLELGLVLLVVDRLGIEQGRGLPALVPLVFVGFVVHACLPRRHRLAAFLLLSLLAFALAFEPVQAAALVAIGLLLVGVCHLPVPWAARLLLLVLAGAVLTAMRAQWIEAAWASAMLPILGSVFMFRLVLYVYDLRTEATPASPTERLAYFFLLPNALFPLFPIVDYKTFLRTYYDDDAHAIHAKGVRWIQRGVLHLLLYRLIYLNFTPAAEDVHDLGTLVLYAVSSYALYLRVSGLFHLVIGILCLFGFDLPETHHRYFLASGFNDLWRRINIYWKDFMMKIVYYPIFIRVRRRNAAGALVLATLAVFLVSWWLHSYQWFWIRGSFPLTRVDAIFWSIFAVAVLANSMLQMRRRARRPSAHGAIGVRDALVRSLKVVAMFSFMCLLWSFWTGPSVEAFGTLLGAAKDAPAMQWEWLILGLIAAVAVGTAFGALWQRPLERLLARTPAGGAFAVRSATMLGLLAVADPGWTGYHPLVDSVRRERLNLQDEELLLRGYYEEILDAGRTPGGVWELEVEKPAHWVRLNDTDAMVRSENPLIDRELRPDFALEFLEARLTTNRWGMRDRDYPRDKAPGVHRTAVLGASIEMGSGVEDAEVFEALVEDALNARYAGLTYDRYELLNFSVNGLSPLAQLALLEERVLGFAPDALLFFCHTIDARILLTQLERMLERGVEIPYPKLRTIVETTRLPPEQLTLEADNLATVWHYQKALLAWIYVRIVETCRERGVVPVWVYLQHPPDQTPGLVNRGRDLLELAASAGFVTIVLDGTRIYPDGEWRSLVLRPWDNHPNPEGHRRIAAELLRQLELHDERLTLGLAGTR